MRREFRIKILKALAQDIKTDTVIQNKPISMPSALLASQTYPTLGVAYSSTQTQLIDFLVNKLNVASHIVTGGALNFQKLKNMSFNFDQSQFTSADQKNIVVFFTKVYKTLLNNGNTFSQKLTKEQIKENVDQLLSAPELSNLSRVNPTGMIAKHISANFQQGIRDILTRLTLA